ncbi:ABC transporter substrate-binding protein, partial [Serratia marcescens]|uniref:ABC transporter substrate-binding protein n=1 Tax=Serratia marcescens TaxID=615 RepID=UPI0023B79FE9
GKIIMFNGPGSIRLSNEACGPTTIHYVFDTYGQANVTGLAAVRSGLDTWFFLTADYAFGQGEGHQRRRHQERRQGARRRA